LKRNHPFFTGFPVRGRLSLSASLRGQTSDKEISVGLADPDWAYVKQVRKNINTIKQHLKRQPK
jgi:hypothetical protein